MIIKSVEAQRLGFPGYKYWNIKFTSNDIVKDQGMIIQALAEEKAELIPVLTHLERENGFVVGPLTDKVIKRIELLASQQ